MKPRLDIQFPLRRQIQFWCGKEYSPNGGEYLLNHARTGIVMALRAALPKGGRVGVVAYNCHTVANAVVNAGCEPFFVDVTEDLRIDVSSVPMDLDAIVVTNLFGIRNNVEAIRKRLPKAIIIVDNAHGYGLPVEGDFTVYSINQGKFPALGEGGILYAIEDWRLKIDDLYKALPSYGFVAQVKLFASMIVKAIAYSRCMYWLTMKLKKSANPDVHGTVSMKRMAPGVRRLYQAWLPSAETEIAKQKRNAEKIDRAFYGENGFMAIVRCENTEGLKKEFAKRGVETETHFKNAITWAKQFGYVEGSCPNAEELTTKLLMIPTYTKI
jgi:dTDP-4-amino-4,6-dideoxygalactose transaminase